MQGKKSFLKSSGLAFAARIIGAASGICMTYVISTNLAVDEAGLFFFAFAIFTVLGTLSTLGLTTAFIRFIGGFLAENNWGVINGIFRAGFKATLLIAMISAVLLYLVSSQFGDFFFQNAGLHSVLAMFALGIPCFALYQLLGYAFQGVHKPVVSAFILNISTQWIVILSLAVAITLGTVLSAANVATVFSAGAFITLVIGLWYWIKLGHWKTKADYSEQGALIESAKPLCTVMVMMLLVQWSGQLIAGGFLPAEQIAFLSVAMRLGALTSFVLVAVNMVAAPRFAASAKLNNNDDLRAASLFCTRIMVSVATPVLIFVLLFAEFLMGLFGEEYTQGADLLRIFVVGQFVNVVTGSVGYLLNMTGHEKDMRNLVFFTGPLALVLGFILTPLYGATGAALSTAIAIGSQNILAVYMVKKRLGFNTLNFINQ